MSVKLDKTSNNLTITCNGLRNHTHKAELEREQVMQYFRDKLTLRHGTK